MRLQHVGHLVHIGRCRLVAGHQLLHLLRRLPEKAEEAALFRLRLRAEGFQIRDHTRQQRSGFPQILRLHAVQDRVGEVSHLLLHAAAVADHRLRVADPDRLREAADLRLLSLGKMPGPLDRIRRQAVGSGHQRIRSRCRRFCPLLCFHTHPFRLDRLLFFSSGPPSCPGAKVVLREPLLLHHHLHHLNIRAHIHRLIAEEAVKQLPEGVVDGVERIGDLLL